MVECSMLNALFMKQSVNKMQITVIHISQAHSLGLRGHLVMFQSGFTFTVNWLMLKVIN